MDQGSLGAPRTLLSPHHWPLCFSARLPDTLLSMAGPGWLHPCSLKTGCSLTRAFDGRRWHRQGLWCWSIHSALAESGADVLARFPGHKELSVCGRAASKVVM